MVCVAGIGVPSPIEFRNYVGQSEIGAVVEFDVTADFEGPSKTRVAYCPVRSQCR